MQAYLPYLIRIKAFLRQARMRKEIGRREEGEKYETVIKRYLVFSCFYFCCLLIEPNQNSLLQNQALNHVNPQLNPTFHIDAEEYIRRLYRDLDHKHLGFVS